MRSSGSTSSSLAQGLAQLLIGALGLGHAAQAEHPAQQGLEQLLLQNALAQQSHGAVLHGGQVVPLADGVHPAVGGLAILPQQVLPDAGGPVFKLDTILNIEIAQKVAGIALEDVLLRHLVIVDGGDALLL